MFHTWIFIYCEEGRTVCIYTEDSEGSRGECKSFVGSLVTTQRDVQRTGQCVSVTVWAAGVGGAPPPACLCWRGGWGQTSICDPDWLLSFTDAVEQSSVPFQCIRSDRRSGVQRTVTAWQGVCLQRCAVTSTCGAQGTRIGCMRWF